MGYQVTTVTPPNSAPSAPAALPSIRILPCVAFMRAARKGGRWVKLACACSHPARTAAWLSASALGFRPSWASSAFSISSSATPSSSASTPT